MRILLDVSAVPARPVGAGVYTVALARGLAARNELELHLLARRDDADRWSELAPTASVHPEVPTARPARLAWEQLRAPGLARRLAVDVWHGPHYTLPLRVDTPTVVTVHDLTFFDHPEWHERAKVAFFVPMMRRSVHHASAVVAVSEHTRERLECVLAPTTPVVVAPHGVDHDRFRPAAVGDPDDLMRLARVGIAPPYLAFAGLLEPRKDVPSLIAAFARLAPQRRDLRLVIAGRDGWGAEAVGDAAAHSGVTTRILRTGWVPSAALPALFRQAAAVVYPSLEEGFGLPALEALACGAVLVTTTGSATAEVVGDAALLVPPAQPGLLADTLGYVLDNAADAPQLRSAGPKQAAPYTWDRSVDRHLDAYRAAVGVAG
ncbi:MAG: glycosyltransferase family 4 protein [Actinobacteria bacterium]|nr:glycosyltransferase family 4 protein [Actinomycetota bacterium]